jgi:L,D-peptidoglycan transpeptidase YkuD (ErfK/YbiS/YcfS/YnhG family)
VRLVLRARPRAGNGRAGLARRPLLVALALAALVCAALVTAPIVLGWTTPPTHTLDAARRGVAVARDQDAAVWAPERLAEAESLLHESETEYRRQEVRLLPLRNFAAARDGLVRAREAALHAAREAEERRVQARSSANHRLSAAERLADDAEILARGLPLLPETSGLLQRSRIRLREARSFFLRGEYRLAAEAAGQTSATTREVLRQGLARASRYVDPEQVEQWRRQADETVAWSRRTGRAAIVIYKEKNLLRLYVGGRLQRSCYADMGSNVVPRKLYSGDSATPEGSYRITVKKGLGRTKYHRALLLDYPSEEDRRRLEQARRAGRVAADATPGGLIEVHGDGGSGEDWTAGCVAISNAEMDDLFGRVRVGTPVTIVGGDGKDGRFSDLYRSLAHHVDRSRD